MIQARQIAKLRWYTTIAVLAVFILTAGGVVSAVYANDDRSSSAAITIHADGEREVVTTDADTVEEVLERAGIELEGKDRVEPGLDTEITNDTFTITVHRARSLIVEDEDGSQHRLRTAYQQERKIAGQVLDIKETDEFETELVTDFITANYVGQKIVVERGAVEVIETIDPPVQEVLDDNKPAGQREVRQPGRPGQVAITYEIEYRDGKEVERTEVDRTIKQEPQARIVAVGNQFSYDGGSLNEEQMNALGFCESGMTADRNSGNGFYGAFQFMPSTWRSVTGRSDMPHQAPLSVQKEAVQKLLSQSSIFTQFPSCARQMRADGIL